MSSKEFWKVMNKNFTQLVQLHNAYMDQINFGTESFGKLFDKEFDIDYKIPSNYIFREGRFVGCTIFHLLPLSPDLCQILIDHGADYTKKNKQGSTVLLKEASSEYEKYLCTPKLRDMLEQVEGWCANVILSAHINLQNPKNPKDKNGLSHFHVACMFNRTDAAKFFLENGVSINESVNEDSTFYPGYSALHFAVRSCAFETVELLLTLGADVFAKDYKGMNPLHVLIFDRREIFCKHERLSEKAFSKLENSKNFNSSDHYSKNEQIIYLLLNKMKECGFYLDNDTGLSYFHVLCFMGNLPMIKQLLDDNREYLRQSVSTDSPIWPGFTPLHFAVHSNVETVELLVKSGADLKAKDANGVTPFDICLREFTIADVCRILLLQPDYMNILFSDGKTKLCDFIHAMQETETFGSFLENNITDPNMFVPFDSPICAGYTPLHLTIICTQQPMSWTSKNCDSDSLKYARQDYKKFQAYHISRINSCLHFNPYVTSKDAKDSTPLHYAFRLQQSQVVHMLLERHESNSNPVDEHGLSHLHIACAAGNETVAQKLLLGGANVNAITTSSHIWRDVEKVNSTIYMNLNTEYFMNKGSTPLHFAKSNMCFETVKILISNGADVLSKDANDLNPLEGLLKTSIFQDTVCLEQRHCWHIGDEIKETIKLLIKKIGDELVETKPNQMLHCFDLLTDRLLREILSQEDESTMKILASVGITPLHVACFSQNLERVNELVEKYDVNASVDLKSPIWPGWTALHFLIYSTDYMFSGKTPNEAILDKLLENGADVAALNAKGETPIHLIFAFKRYPGCVDKLLEHLKNFNVNPTSPKGYTHLHVASACGDVATVEKLLEHGAVIDQPTDYFVGSLYARDHAGCTALHFAAARQQKYVVDVLLKNGADVNRRNADGKNPLHFSICGYHEQRSVELLQTLIGAGADIYATDMYEQTPFETLIRSPNPTKEEIELFLKHGCPVNTVNRMSNEGLLAIALKQSQELPIFEMLIKAPDVKDINDNGQNAIHNVVSFKRSDCEEFAWGNIHEGYTRPEEYVRAIDLLTKLGLNIDHQDCKGSTPLHVAAQMQNLSGTFGLLVNGADINIGDANGKPAFAYSVGLVELHKEPRKFDFQILDMILCHICKLNLVKIGISQSNREVYEKIRENYWNNESVVSFEAYCCSQIEVMKEEKISSTSVTFYEFLSDTGAVSAFPYMLPCDRMAIASFFKNETKTLREYYSLFAGVLILQCRKALARCDMIDSAVSSLNILLGFDIPDICSRITLRFLSNDELINLISSTNNEC